MSFSPLSFSGVSSFSDDFQSILKRAVDIASLPVKNLQNRQVDLLGKKNAFTSLRGVVGGLAVSLKALGTVGKNRALTASSSDSAKLTVTNVSAASAGSYTISDVTSLAKGASETSATGYATTTSTPVSASGTVRITYGAETRDITLTAGENNLQGLRDKINALGIGVTAAVLTTGTGANPNYLSLTADTAGATTLTLVDDPGGAGTALLTNNNQGADTVFKLNGVTVNKKSSFINDVVPGITFTLLNKTEAGEELNITLASGRNAISGALQDLVTKYNDATASVRAEVGERAGILSGELVIRELQSRFRKLASYQSGGEINTLAEVGLEFDNSGQLTFNKNAFDALSDSQVEGVLDFIGTTTTGFGALYKDFSRISDPIDGMIAVEQSQIDKTDLRLQNQISIMLDRISDLQLSVSKRLQNADTVLARLEGQQQIVDASVQSLSLVLFGKKG